MGLSEDDLVTGYIKGIYFDRIKLKALEKIGYEHSFPFLEDASQKTDYYTDHGKNHCERIVRRLNDFTERFCIELTECEKFLLLSSIYLHDIGMFDFRELDTIDKVRAEHELRSCDFVKTLNLTSITKDAIKRIIKAHQRKYDLKEYNAISREYEFPKIFKLDSRFSEENVRLRLLGALIRLGDACDVTNERTPKSIFTEACEKGTYKTKEEWLRHMCISRVEFEELDQCVCLTVEHTGLPQNKVVTLADKTQRSIEEEIESIQKILNDKDYLDLSIPLNLKVEQKFLPSKEDGKEMRLEYTGFNPAYERYITIYGTKEPDKEFGKVEPSNILCQKWVENCFVPIPKFRKIIEEIESFDSDFIRKNYFIKSPTRTGKTGILSKMCYHALTNKGIQPIIISCEEKMMINFEDLMNDLKQFKDYIVIFDDIQKNKDMIILIESLLAENIVIWCSCRTEEFNVIQDHWKNLEGKFIKIESKELLSHDDIKSYINGKISEEQSKWLDDNGKEYLLSLSGKISFEYLDNVYRKWEKNTSKPLSLEDLKSVPIRNREILAQRYNTLNRFEKFITASLLEIAPISKELLKCLVELFESSLDIDRLIESLIIQTKSGSLKLPFVEETTIEICTLYEGMNEILEPLTIYEKPVIINLLFKAFEECESKKEAFSKIIDLYDALTDAHKDLMINKVDENKNDDYYLFLASALSQKDNRFLTFTTFALTRQEIPTNIMLNFGLAHGLSGNHEKALNCFIKITDELDPKHADAWYNKGVALDKLGKSLEEQLECYNKAIEADPKHAYAWYNKGVVLGKLGKSPEEQLECYNKAIEIEPKHTSAWYNKGVVLGKLGKHDEALKCFTKVTDEADPKHASAWVNKGVVLGKLGKSPEEQLECYNKAIEIEPKHADAWYNKGVVLGKLGKSPEEQLECYNKAIEADPKHASAWVNKGVALGELGKSLEEQLECYNKAIEADPKHADAWYNKGVALDKLGKSLEEQLECYNKAIEADPKHASAWYNKGVVLGKLGNHKEALGCFSKVTDELDPKHASAWYNISCLIARSEGDKEKEEILRCLANAIKLDKKYIKMAEEDSDFDNIREKDWFKNFLEKHKKE